MSNPTHRPWRVVDDPNNADRDWREIRSNLTNSPVVEMDRYGYVHGGMTHTLCGVRMTAEDAAFIVQACNNFEDMIAVLESLIEDARERDEDMGQMGWPEAIAVVAKAKGEAR